MPEKFATVEAFLAALSGPRREHVDALRALIDSAHPELVEQVKWNSPSWALHGVDRLTINAHRSDAVLVVLHSGTAIAEDRKATPEFTGDPDGLLTWHSNIRASLSTTSAADVTQRHEAISAVITNWLAAGA